MSPLQNTAIYYVGSNEDFFFLYQIWRHLLVIDISEVYIYHTTTLLAG